MKAACVCSYDGDYSVTLLDRLCTEHGISRMVARALVRRSITETEAVAAYLHPDSAPLLDPFDLPDMEQAAERIHAAVQSGERICIYGDYDADGVCATAILMQCLRGLGADVHYYIPSRHEEGYGMHEEAVERIAKQGTSLLITVDNGIAAHAAAMLCITLHMDLIVTDHHLPPECLPPALAVVAASRKDSAYGNAALCGAGVALKLALALTGKPLHEEWLALAAVATVADVVPLIGENRTIAARGLKKIMENTGLSALLEIAGYSGKPLTSETIAFTVAPRLNAAGRMGDAARAVALLLETDAAGARRYAEELEAENRARRLEEDRIFREIDSRYPPETLRSRRAIVLHGADWHLGVIGIAAARLTEQYHCPVLLFGERGGKYVGSCRSVPDIQLYDCLQVFSAYFDQFGGHARAAGVTMQPERFDAFADAFERYIRDNYADDAFEPVYSFEEDAELSALNMEQVRALEVLAPFGEGNPEPVFRIRQATLNDVRRIGQQGSHLSVSVAQNGCRMRAVGFGFGAKAESLCMSGKWTVLGIPRINRFNGSEKVEIQLSAVLFCDVSKLLRAFLENVLYNTVVDCDKLCDLFFVSHGFSLFSVLELEAGALRKRFVQLRAAIGPTGLDASRLQAMNNPNDLWGFCLFLELGFFAFDVRTQRILPADHPQQRSLQESRLYRMALERV